MTSQQLIKARLKEAERRKRKPEGRFIEVDLTEREHPKWMTRAFANNRYIVMIMDNAETDKGKAIRAMVQTVDDKPIERHWKEMQRIKNEIFGPEVMAIEYYPKESELQDLHNIYWMWIFPEGTIPTPKP
jgi:1-acyl-sn-glycerol-3-phosphate acyltransferase